MEKNVPYLGITEVLLIHCNVGNNSHQQNSRVQYTFFPNKSFVQLLDILPENFLYLKTFDSEFSYIEVWFMDHPLETEDKINKYSCSGPPTFKSGSGIFSIQGPYIQTNLCNKFLKKLYKIMNFDLHT